MHNQVLLEMIDGLTERAAVEPSEFDAVAFGAGPGSFTGVRIAAATAQSIALVAGAVIVPVASSRAMVVASALRAGKVVSVTRSRGDAYYLAGYEYRAQEWELVLDDALHSEWPTMLLNGAWEFVGERPVWSEVEGMPQWRGAAAVDSNHIAELGLQQFLAAGGLDPADGLPRYVSGDTPWQPS
jgi:tRNA threonylcarbamoyladenosine biosynthesis protein TsaB